jgi:elongation factor Ts
LDALLKLPLRGDKVSVEAGRQALISKLGENIQVRRFHLTRAQNQVGVYLHGSRIGVIVDITGGDETLARDIAMHIAASRPLCINEDDVPGELLDKEREIFSAQAQASGKPPEIVDKMVQGRLKKYLGEITLLGQPFVKDPDKTVGRLLRESNAVVTSFVRFEVGEGLEKKTGNFADEVMAQVRET